MQNPAQWFAVNLFDDETQQEVAGIAVVLPGAGREVHGSGMGDPDDFFRCQTNAVDIVRCDCLVVGNAGGMCQDMPHRHTTPFSGEKWQVLVDRVVQPEFLLLDEEHGCGCNKLFADRADLEDRLAGDGHLEFDVGHPVSL